MSRRRSKSCLKGERGRQTRHHLAHRDGQRCFYCRAPFDDPSTATIDHYVPYSLWRTNRRTNLVLACDPCNQRKGAQLPIGLVLVLAGRQA